MSDEKKPDGWVLVREDGTFSVLTSESPLVFQTKQLAEIELKDIQRFLKGVGGGLGVSIRPVKLTFLDEEPKS